MEHRGGEHGVGPARGEGVVKMEVGTYFTVLDHPRNPTDHSWRGDVFRVLAFEYPFVAAQMINKTYGDGRISFDLRDWELTELTPEYVEAMVPHNEGVIR